MTRPPRKPALTDAQVRDFLKAHPDFLKHNSDVVAHLTPPERSLGNGIIDFQHYLVKNLQKDSEALKDRYDVLIEFCRDNMAVQAQVHNAALKLIRARNIEQLLEALTVDLVNLFDVDVVRLAMESDTARRLDQDFGRMASGIVLVESGTTELALGRKKNVRLIEDCAADPPAGFEEIFADCADLIESAALLKLSLESIDRPVMLVFGVRHKDRFHPGQGIELLNFLARIVAHQLDLYLDDLMP
jgi:hypothetical protein